MVAKLAVIVDLSMSKEEPELKEEMNEDDIIKLNWMQGAQVKTIPVSDLRVLRPQRYGCECTCEI